MSADGQIDIQTLDDFLRWLDANRQSTIQFLATAGIKETEATWWAEHELSVFAGSTISSPEQSPVYVTAEIELAIEVLNLIRRIRDRVTGKEIVPLFVLVLEGVRLIDFQRRIYEPRWKTEDFSAQQRTNAKMPRSLTTQLKQFEDWRERMPEIVGAQETFGRLVVTYKGSGRYVIEDRTTGKATKPVLLDSIAKKRRT